MTLGQPTAVVMLETSTHIRYGTRGGRVESDDIDLYTLFRSLNGDIPHAVFKVRIHRDTHDPRRRSQGAVVANGQLR